MCWLIFRNTADFASLTTVIFRKAWLTAYYFYFIDVPTPQHLCDSPKMFISQTPKSIHRQTHQGYLLFSFCYGISALSVQFKLFPKYLCFSLTWLYVVCCMSLLYTLIRLFGKKKLFLNNSAAVTQDPSKFLHSHFKHWKCSAVS